MSQWHRERYGPKVCTGCGLEKPIEEFGRRNRTPDGRKARCKNCERAMQREYYARNREAMRAKARNYRDPAKALARNATWRRANPEKKAAHAAVEYAIQVGKLVRPDRCADCGAECRPHGHHDDYLRALDVRWLCPACHRAAHTYLEEAAA